MTFEFILIFSVSVSSYFSLIYTKELAKSRNDFLSRV